MDNVITALLAICLSGFIYGFIKLKTLLSLGEVNSFNIMSAQKLSPESNKIKKQALSGFMVFILSILTMLILSGIYGPIKG